MHTWLRDGNVPEDPDDCANFLETCWSNPRSPSLGLLSEFSTPRQLGLESGTKLRLYPSPAFRKLQCCLSDVARDRKEPVPLLVSSYSVDVFTVYKIMFSDVDARLPILNCLSTK